MVVNSEQAQVLVEEEGQPVRQTMQTLVDQVIKQGYGFCLLLLLYKTRLVPGGHTVAFEKDDKAAVSAPR